MPKTKIPDASEVLEGGGVAVGAKVLVEKPSHRPPPSLPTVPDRVLDGLTEEGDEAVLSEPYAFPIEHGRWIAAEHVKLVATTDDYLVLEILR